jgi:hypothetical protein
MSPDRRTKPPNLSIRWANRKKSCKQDTRTSETTRSSCFECKHPRQFQSLWRDRVLVVRDRGVGGLSRRSLGEGGFESTRPDHLSLTLANPCVSSSWQATRKLARRSGVSREGGPIRRANSGPGAIWRPILGSVPRARSRPILARTTLPAASHARDLTDEQWVLIGPLLPKLARRTHGRGAPI